MITDDPRRPHQPARVDTDGGAVFQGDVQAGRDVIGRDKIEVTVSADSRYDVAGLENPYLGLRAFTYDDRDRFAGRQGEICRAVEILATPGEERTLLFITGASGSGKSSLAQAGLLPAPGTPSPSTAGAAPRGRVPALPQAAGHAGGCPHPTRPARTARDRWRPTGRHLHARRLRSDGAGRNPAGTTSTC